MILNFNFWTGTTFLLLFDITLRLVSYFFHNENQMIMVKLFLQGFAIRPEGGIELITDIIKDELGDKLRVSVLMGANLAPEVAKGMFCETTIGCVDAVRFTIRNLDQNT